MSTPTTQPLVGLPGGNIGATTAPPNLGSVPITAAQQAENAAMTASGKYTFANGSTGTATEPSVISTNRGKDVLNGEITKHNADVANLGTSQTATTTGTDTGAAKPSTATTDAMKGIGGLTADEAKAAGINVTDTSQYTYDPTSGYFLPKNGTKADQDKFESDKTTINNAFNAQKSLMDASTQNLISSLNAIYDARMQAQRDVNAHELAAFNTMNVRGGTSRYAGGVAQSILTADENAGLQRIAAIAAEQAGKIAEAQQNLQAKEYTAFMDNRAAIDKLTTERNATLKDLQDKAVAEQTKQKDAAQKVQDNINSVILEAAKNGASAEVQKAIQGAKTYADAIAAAGDSLQTGTGTLGDYLQYKRDMIAKGLVPSDYLTFKNEQDKKTAQLEYTKSYNTELGKAAGQAAAAGLTPVDTTPTGVLGNDTKGGSILNQTGLSIQAFNFLTQGTSALTRMTAPERKKYMDEANSFLTKNNLDNSTFQSQYKAYNDVLAKNIARATQTQVMAGEVSGSADSLIDAIDQNDLGALKDVKAAVIVDLLAGKQVNSPVAMKYATQIKFMANDLAGYFAAARGATSPELQDQRDAADVISNGLSKGSVQAFKDSVNANEEKVAGVVQKAVDSTRQQVWGLFGVGGNYESTPVTVDPQKGVETFISTLPKDDPLVSQITKMAAIPGSTPATIYAWLKANGKIK